VVADAVAAAIVRIVANFAAIARSALTDRSAGNAPSVGSVRIAARGLSVGIAASGLTAASARIAASVRREGSVLSAAVDRLVVEVEWAAEG
jgi:hypothetical protein